MTDGTSLYENIRKLRKEKGMSQSDLAAKLGYASNSMVAQIENGQIDLPFSKVLAIADAFGVSLPVLLGYAEELELYREAEKLPCPAKEYVSKQIIFARDYLIPTEDGLQFNK